MATKKRTSEELKAELYQLRLEKLPDIIEEINKIEQERQSFNKECDRKIQDLMGGEYTITTKIEPIL